MVCAISFNSVLAAQSADKKTYVYDENWQLIDMKKFQKIAKKRGYTYKLIENDTALIGKLMLREEIGKISAEDRTLLVNYLKKLTKLKVDTSNTIVINFFFKPENDPKGSCIDNYTSDYSYKRYFKKNTNAQQFFVTQQGFGYKKKHVYEDKENLVRHLLFKYYFGCGNYIIIKPNGDYLLWRGEYKQDEIPEKISTKW